MATLKQCSRLGEVPAMTHKSEDRTIDLWTQAHRRGCTEFSATENHCTWWHLDGML
jgi:hypothetical protein